MAKRQAMSTLVGLDKEYRRSNLIWIWRLDKCNVSASKNAHTAALNQNNNWLIGQGLLQIFLHRVYAAPEKGLAMQIITSNMLVAENSWQPCLNCQSKGPQCMCKDISIKKTHRTKLDWWLHSHSFCSKTKVHHRALSTHPHSTRLIIPNGLSRRR